MCYPSHPFHAEENPVVVIEFSFAYDSTFESLVRYAYRAFFMLCTADKSISDALNARRAKILESVSYSRAINHEEISPFRKDKAGSRDIVGDNSL